MAKQDKLRRVSISAVRQANESLVRQNGQGRFLSENQSAGRVIVRTVYYGRRYEIDLSQNDINEAYAKSVQAVSK